MSTKQIKNCFFCFLLGSLLDVQMFLLFFFSYYNFKPFANGNLNHWMLCGARQVPLKIDALNVELDFMVDFQFRLNNDHSTLSLEWKPRFVRQCHSVMGPIEQQRDGGFSHNLNSIVTHLDRRPNFNFQPRCRLPILAHSST